MASLVAALLTAFLTSLAVLLAVPCAVFAVEIVASLASRWQQASSDVKPRVGIERNMRLSVLVPAHNEAAGIAKTLEGIKAQLQPGDRLLVVADNCSDDTAAIATALGAEVSVRTDSQKIGKGYALDWGLRQLASDASDVVIVIDADCGLAPLALNHLAYTCRQSDRPVQALYLMTAPDGSRVNHQVAGFAWRVKNLVRPLGLKALGLPCQLMGTGMAFPWATIASVDLGSGQIVEDLKLGLDLARAGHPPIFCPAALVTSTFPTSAEGAKAQRQRWEHGQLALISANAIPHLWEAIVQRNLGLLALVFDLLVPPLSLFVGLLVVTAFASLLWALLGHRPVPLIISGICLVAFTLATALAWAFYGRAVLPARSLALIPIYLLTKVRHYASALFKGRTSRWVRTDRT